MAYLHTNNIYFGDMKPENLLLFKDYRIKLGDLGVSMKIPDDFTPDSKIYLKGLTPKYSLESLEARY
jgi:serine/threonine protein kinase